MTRYIITLSEQEELSLKQLVTQPGFEPMMKLFQSISLDAQSKAMDCESKDVRERSQVLLEAQVTRDVVSNITHRLYAYREALLPDMPDDVQRIIDDNLWMKERN